MGAGAYSPCGSSGMDESAGSGTVPSGRQPSQVASGNALSSTASSGRAIRFSIEGAVIADYSTEWKRRRRVISLWRWRQCLPDPSPPQPAEAIERQQGCQGRHCGLAQDFADWLAEGEVPELQRSPARHPLRGIFIHAHDCQGLAISGKHGRFAISQDKNLLPGRKSIQSHVFSGKGILLDS